MHNIDIFCGVGFNKKKEKKLRAEKEMKNVDWDEYSVFLLTTMTMVM